MTEESLTIIFFGILIAIFMGIAFFVSSLECGSKWSSFPNRFGIMKGCQIEVGGKWIPAESYYFKQE